jgi:hypothetical protein
VSSSTEVTHVRDMIGAKTAGVIGTKVPNVTAVEAADVTSAKTTTNMAAAKASHATAMSPAATARLRSCGNKAAGKYSACQNHHHSSSHDILHLRWADIPPQVQSGVDAFLRGRANVAIGWRWECSFAVPTKFAFIRSDPVRRGHGPDRKPKFDFS